MISYSKGLFPSLIGSNINLTRANPAAADFPEKLLHYEERNNVVHYKMGVLYAKEGQTEENDFFSNGIYSISISISISIYFYIIVYSLSHSLYVLYMLYRGGKSSL